MSDFYRDYVAFQVEHYADDWAKRYVAPAFEGDAKAAFDLYCALSSNKRGEVAVAMWQAKVPVGAFRAYLAPAWDHEHQYVQHAAQTRRRLAAMFRYARFPIPCELPPVIRIWRGTSHLSFADARRGYSWTTDRDMACWFAVRLAGSWANAGSLVLTAEVGRPQIVLFHNERGESEVVLMKTPDWVTVDGDAASWQIGFDRVVAGKTQKRLNG
jgi:hypothetical protein